jgi:ABC-type Zn uptake system ZnuABC Zn-binding protein ZnuA
MSRATMLVLVLLGSTFACGGGAPASSSSSRPIVVATLTQVSALVRAVAGDRVELTPLLGPKDDPHQYELTPRQVADLGRATVIFESGVGIDKWMDRGVDAAGARARATDLSRSVKLRPATGSESTGDDPHWWYDADNARGATTAVAQALTAADPAGRSTYQANADRERARLDAADRGVHAAIDPIPQARRLFVANHDAFGYFLARYGITLVGDIVPSTDSIAAVRPADIANLVASIKSRHVCAIFTETTINPGLATQIAREANVKVFDGRLYGDAIGDPGKPGGTLEDALTRNGQTMAGAFTSC